MSNQQQQQQQTYTCFVCKKEIKLRRKEDDSGWLRFDLDGITEHKCSSKQTSSSKQQQQQFDVLNAKIDDLIKKQDN